ncbi:MAG: uracil-DNA glycosylase family protein [Flavobacteriaceae bacterium]
MVEKLIPEISNCIVCKEHLPLGPKPIFAVHPKSKIIIIGQAPGSVVHKTGIPWDDKSGENLRNWMDIKKEKFYNSKKIAIIPMGFCYPGKGKTGDLPPRKECAPLWHTKLLSDLKEIELILLIGKYAQDYYLKEISKKTLTETVKAYSEYLPKYFVLPHPSPRNNIWQAKNEWFKQLVIPELQREILRILK